MFENIIFFGLSTLLLFCAVMVVTRKNPVASAIYLVGTLSLVAALFAFLRADFVAVIQVLVYAGAIMVLFLFVIMILNLEPKLLGYSKLKIVDFFGLFLTVLMFIGLAGYLNKTFEFVLPENALIVESIDKLGGNTQVIGQVLFAKYAWPFELASVLILLAIFGAVVIARKPEKLNTNPGEHQ